MHEYYRLPTLVLLTVLTGLFLWLYLRARSHLRLLWTLGWVLVSLRLIIEWQGIWHVPAGLAISNVCLELAALMFLGSLSPGSVGKTRFHYIQLFSLPLVAYLLLVSLYPASPGKHHLLVFVMAAAATATGIVWASHRNLLPVWFTLPYAVIVGGVCIYLTWQGDYMFTLYVVQSAVNLLTAILFLVKYRRLSPGIVLTVVGFIAWSIPGLLDGVLLSHGFSVLVLGRTVNLIKIVTALGMVVLVLEDELIANAATRVRDHRAHLELEAYARINLWGVPGHSQKIYEEVCETVSASSRFAHVAILLRGVEGGFYFAASAGMHLDTRVAVETFARSAEPAAIEQVAAGPSTSLRPLSSDQDGPLYTGMVLRSSAGALDGLLLLGGLRNPDEPLMPDEMLPLELLAARVAALREAGQLTRRILRAEKLAGLGHLAGGVAHELNNPLTAVMGYGQVIEEIATDDAVRSAAAIILQESRRMKKTIESLIRFWRPKWDHRAPLAIAQMLADIEQLRGPELSRSGIKLELRIAPSLPPIPADADHMCQVILQLLNNSVSALDALPEGREKRILIDASRQGEYLRIVVSDTGSGFSDLTHIFDPFYLPTEPREGTGLGLGLCYSIVREHGGDISAVNLYPHGAAVVIELPCESVPLVPQATFTAPTF